MLTAALVLGGPGCAVRSGGSRVDVARRSAGHAALRVVHVSSESGLRAGTPIDANHVLSSLAYQDVGMYGIVADGLPLRWASWQLDVPPARLAKPAAFPILGFFAGPAVFQPNRLHPDARLVAGQRVIIAGYFLVGDADDLPGLWDAPAAVVHARVLDASSIPSRPDRKDLLWLAAPAGDYRGFCGGPVGLEAPAGPASVVGVILFQHHDPSAGPDADAILAAQGI